MYEQTYIILDGEILGNNVVLNRYFIDIHNISTVIIKDFIKIIDIIDILDKPVRIKSFNIEKGNYINIYFKSKTDTGNVIFSYVLDKYNNLVMEGYLLQITSGENAGFRLFGKDFENNNNYNKLNEYSDKDNFSNPLEEILSDKTSPNINSSKKENDCSVLTEKEETGLNLNNIDNDNPNEDELKDNNTDIIDNNDNSEESIEIESEINNDILNPETEENKDNLELSEEFKYNNQIPKLEIIQVIERIKTDENNCSENNKELENIETLKKDDFVEEPDEKEISKEEIEENIETIYNQETECDNEFIDVSSKDLENISETENYEENNIFNDNSVEEDYSSKFIEDELENESFDIIKENLSANNSDDNKSDNDKLNFEEKILDTLSENMQIFENTNSDIVDFFDIIPRFELADYDYELVNTSNIIEQINNQIEESEKNENLNKYNIKSNKLDKDTKISMYKNNFVGYDKNMAATKIDMLKQKIKELQKNKDVTSDDVLDAQIELLTDNKAKAFRILDSSNKDDVLQLDDDLFLSKDKVYRWGDILILNE